MNEIRDFFYGKENSGSIFLHARWRFVDSIGSLVATATEEDNPHGLPVKLVEFLSVDVAFYPQQAYWSWFTETQNEVMERLYRAARNGTTSRLINWLGGFDWNRRTTKENREQFLKSQVDFNNSIIGAANELHVFPVWPSRTR